MSQTVTLSFFRFAGFGARAWALMMMGMARGALGKTPDIGFWKLCGSGTGDGFSLTVNPSVIAILAVWPDAETARDRITQAPVFAKFRRNSVEDWSVLLTPTSVRGAWDGVEPFAQQAEQAPGPMAALTRASIKKGVIPRFWRQVPDISAMIGADPHVAFKAGFGELPMVDQITFSIWPSKSAMDGFARTGPHGDAIKSVRAHGWFSEELFARFTVQSDMGSWGGTSPLARLDVA